MPRFYSLSIHPYNDGAQVFLANGQGEIVDTNRSFVGFKRGPEITHAVKDFLRWEAEVSEAQLTEDVRAYLEETA